MTKKKVKKGPRPTPKQVRAMRRLTSFGVMFERRKPITETRQGKKVRYPGKKIITSVRRFGSENEANRHGKRFMRIEKHVAYKVILVRKSPNAWVNLRSGKTNPARKVRQAKPPGPFSKRPTTSATPSRSTPVGGSSTRICAAPRPRHRIWLWSSASSASSGPTAEGSRKSLI